MAMDAVRYRKSPKSTSFLDNKITFRLAVEYSLVSYMNLVVFSPASNRNMYHSKTTVGRREAQSVKFDVVNLIRFD